MARFLANHPRLRGAYDHLAFTHVRKDLRNWLKKTNGPNSGLKPALAINGQNLQGLGIKKVNPANIMLTENAQGTNGSGANTTQQVETENILESAAVQQSINDLKAATAINNHTNPKASKRFIAMLASIGAAAGPSLAWIANIPVLFGSVGLTLGAAALPPALVVGILAWAVSKKFGKRSQRRASVEISKMAESNLDSLARGLNNINKGVATAMVKAVYKGNAAKVDEIAAEMELEKLKSKYKKLENPTIEHLEELIQKLTTASDKISVYLYAKGRELADKLPYSTNMDGLNSALDHVELLSKIKGANADIVSILSAKAKTVAEMIVYSQNADGLFQALKDITSLVNRKAPLIIIETMLKDKASPIAKDLGLAAKIEGNSYILFPGNPRPNHSSTQGTAYPNGYYSRLDKGKEHYNALIYPSGESVEITTPPKEKRENGPPKRNVKTEKQPDSSAAQVESADFIEIDDLSGSISLGSGLDILKGTKFVGKNGEYTLLDKIGAGGMGTACIGTNFRGERIVIKFMQLADIIKTEMEKVGRVDGESILTEKEAKANIISYILRFENEFTLGKRLTHPNAARIIDTNIGMALGNIDRFKRVFKKDSKSGEYIEHTDARDLILEGFNPAAIGKEALFIVSEFIPKSTKDNSPGLTVDQHFVHGTRPKETVAHFLPVLECLSHAHDQNVAHRDLKPANLVVTIENGKPVIKVIDLGIARNTDKDRETALTKADQAMGTVRYMPPSEYFASAGKNSEGYKLFDIYSIGLILFELVAGDPFENSTNATDIFVAKETGGLPFVQIAHEGLRTVITKMLSADPKNNYQSMPEVIDALRKINFNGASKAAETKHTPLSHEQTLAHQKDPESDNISLGHTELAPPPAKGIGSNPLSVALYTAMESKDSKKIETAVNNLMNEIDEFASKNEADNFIADLFAKMGALRLDQPSRLAMNDLFAYLEEVV
jgi:serine/threonine protein kinase